MGRLPFNTDDLPDRDIGKPARRERHQITGSGVGSNDKTGTGVGGDKKGGSELAAFTVTQVVNLIAGVLAEKMPRPLRVVGEVSNFRDRNHWYLTLKDAGVGGQANVIDCVMWASAARKAGFVPERGQQVVATGKCDFYGPQGKLQIYIDKLEPVGQGVLEQQLRQLMEELRGEGYFAEEHKLPMPVFPQRIAVVTSESGAALHDVIETARRRWAGCQLMLVDVRVQGAEAAGEIAAAITALSDHHERLGLDAVIVTRGGGSLEDLWAFNERVVADAIYKATLPIVAAIGHETDLTVAELVADMRCSTPTQAAERLVPDAVAEQQHLQQLTLRLNQACKRRLEYDKVKLEGLARLDVFRRPAWLVENNRRCVNELQNNLTQSLTDSVGRLTERLGRYQRAVAGIEPGGLILAGQAKLIAIERRGKVAMGHRFDQHKQRLNALARQLEAIGPSNVLSRGYSYTTDAGGRLIQKRGQVAAGDQIKTHLAFGVIDSTVNDKSKKAVNQAKSGDLAQKTGRSRVKKSVRKKKNEPEGGLFDEVT